MYLNTVDFGNNSFGIKMAARSYFDTTPEKLTVNQSAVLVGLLKGTSRFSPLNSEERATARRNTVLSLMRKHGEISAEQYDRSEEHTSELQSLMRISYAVFCLNKKNT